MIHQAIPLRMDALLRTLIRRGHTIANDDTADVWFVDCIWPHKIYPATIDQMLSFGGKIVLVSLGDLNIFNIDGLPDELIQKVSAFAKIQWDNDTSIYDSRIIGKSVTIHPFLVSHLPQPTTKKHRVCFLGLPTGAENAEDNLRIRACRILKKQPWFIGGIVGQEGGATPRDISGIEVGELSRNMYLRSINRSLISLCMPGNSPLTYRLFESLGVCSAVISCRLDSVRWLNRMNPNEHYLLVKDDLSDLLEVCERAVTEPQDTVEIAKTGHDLYQQYYSIMPDRGLTDHMSYDICCQFGECGIHF